METEKTCEAKGHGWACSRAAVVKGHCLGHRQQVVKYGKGTKANPLTPLNSRGAPGVARVYVSATLPKTVGALLAALGREHGRGTSHGVNAGFRLVLEGFASGAVPRPKRALGDVPAPRSTVSTTAKVLATTAAAVEAYDGGAKQLVTDWARGALAERKAS